MPQTRRPGLSHSERQRTLSPHIFLACAASLALSGTGCAQPADAAPVVCPTLPASPGPRLSTFADHTCFLRLDGAVYCWGSNSQGQLRPGPSGDPSPPVEVKAARGSLAVCAGTAHSCALLPDHSMRCWGDDSWGQLGDDAAGTGVTGETSVEQIACGGLNSGAIVNGQVFAWGDDPGSAIPFPIPDIKCPLQLAVAAPSCALRADATLACWGANDSGQLGNGTQTGFLEGYDPHGAVPVNVQALGPILQVSTGARFACAVTTDHAVACWGNGYFGTLGDPARTNRSLPHQLDLHHVNQVSTGTLSGCVLAGAPQQVYCWGAVNQSDEPRRVIGVPSPAVVASGGFHACALTADERVFCWGENSQAQLGCHDCKVTAPVEVVF